MLCGPRDRANQAALSWALTDGRREYRCRLREFQLVREGPVRHDDHLVPGEAASHGQAHDYRIGAEPDA